MEMEKSVTPNAISTILANPSTDSYSEIPQLIVQVVDLKPTGTSRFTFKASDGKMKLMAMLPTKMASDVNLGNIQNLGLILVKDYTINLVPKTQEKCLLVLKCEVVAPVLESEIGSDPKSQEIEFKPKQETGIVLKPKQDVVAKSAAQIVHEQHQNNAPSERMAMTRRVHPLVSLNPYQGNWTIKVRLTSKGNMRTYKNARGEGCVFNVELTDQDGTQIQATLFNEAANKFYNKFELGKVYYISKGTLKVANKQFKTVQNDYEMTLNENSEVEEVSEEGSPIPKAVFNFVKIDDLGTYVNGKELVDVIGVLQSVSPTMSIRRKANNETIPKRDITIADDSNKTVVISLWNDLATTMGQELLDVVDSNPIVAIKCLKVGDFQGVSLSSLGKSTVVVNPDVPEAENLKSWYASEGKSISMTSIGAGLINSTSSGARSFYSDRVTISHITSNSSLGGEKPQFFSIKACISFIKPEQLMWYQACKTCNKKVTTGHVSGYFCDGCQKNVDKYSLRYILALRVSDPSGEAWVSTFNDQAEKILGCSADELDKIKQQDEKEFHLKLKQATWTPHLFRVSVAQNEYNGEKRQRITIRAEAPLDFAVESKYLLEEMSKLQAS
ncbi:hypothetical protein C5167_007208 [Papaver somniferum]|uniref:Replication protein A subunit n=1 Tax=Papaver somniferum TaxID=3469 RepID=A0A4Y7JJI2_PAPSO|nr:replication protein A 70 kDa DNA-binding subunit B-like [Papaver somniferum]RZC59909.1 hypothetical protein C5167_007208 [Papaver somniferum]